LRCWVTARKGDFQQSATALPSTCLQNLIGTPSGVDQMCLFTGSNFWKGLHPVNNLPHTLLGHPKHIPDCLERRTRFSRPNDFRPLSEWKNGIEGVCTILNTVRLASNIGTYVQPKHLVLRSMTLCARPACYFPGTPP